MKILLTGSEGQLGRALIANKPNNIKLIATSKKDLDITNKEACLKIISKYKPKWVINASAYTLVDQAEINTEEAFLVNSIGPNNLAATIKECGGNLLHFSTDFVFSGDQTKPYTPYDAVNPINIYGRSKAEGEIAIQKSLSQTKQAVIIRTRWLFSSVGRNFVLTILKLHKEKENISVVCDQIGSPTTTSSLAQASWKLIQLKESNSGENAKFPTICHFSDSGIASWYDIAISIGELAEEVGLIKKAAKVIPIPSSYYPSKALRPTFSVLDCSTTYKLLGIEPLHWRSSLYELIKELK